MPEVTSTRTRQSLAGQLSKALDAMVKRGQIEAWESHYGEDRAAYSIRPGRSNYGAPVTYNFTPGESMDYVNRHGYDVRFGKA